jgi:hypothetical protein
LIQIILRVVRKVKSILCSILITVGPVTRTPKVSGPLKNQRSFWQIIMSPIKYTHATLKLISHSLLAQMTR